MRNWSLPTYLCLGLLLSIAAMAPGAHAQDATLRDVNGDGFIQIVAFGDSITYGVGDGFEPGEFIEDFNGLVTKEGYPARIENLLGIGVTNLGVRGERLSTQGANRLPGDVLGKNYDIVILMEGSNDANYQINPVEISQSLQRMINVARADGKQVVVMTVAPPTRNHNGLYRFTTAYSKVVRDLAYINGLRLVDVEQGFLTACPVLRECVWYNLPEGLHPNTRGYDAIAQLVAARLLDIDLTDPDSANQLEAALGLAPGTALVGNRAV